MNKKNHNLAIKICFIKFNKMWSYYTLYYAVLESRSRIWIRYTCTAIALLMLLLLVLFFFKRNPAQFRVLASHCVLFCCFGTRNMIYSFLPMNVWMVSDGSSGSSSRIDDWEDGDESNDDDDAMATCRGAMISLSGVCLKSNIKCE